VAWQTSPADLQAPRLNTFPTPGGPASASTSVRSTWHGAPTQEWRRFAIAASLAFVASVAFLIWTKYRIGGDKPTIAVDDIGEGVASGLAAISLAWAAARSSGRLRMAWILLAASAASWTIGEVIWSWYEVFQGVSVPFPSAADIGYLLAIPLADTLKRAERGEPARALSTERREGLWCAQTPQMFRFAILQRAFERPIVTVLQPHEVPPHIVGIP